MSSNTLNILIDPTGAQRGAAQTVAAINTIMNSTTNLNVTINQANRGIDEMGRKADKTSGLLKKLSNAWLLMKTSLILAIPIKMLDTLITKMISVDRSYQQFMASMFVATNDVKKSKEAFEFVSRAARAYGVDLEELSKSYAKFRASASSTLPAQAMDRLFLSLTAVASVLHMAPQSVNRMYTAFTQMASKGQIYSEELKQQLGEHLPGAVALAAQAMGVTVKQLIKMLKDGKVDIVKFFSNMPDVIMKKFGKAAELSALSIQSQINNLKSTIYKNMIELNESGAAMGLAKFIQSIDNILQPTTEHFKVFGKVVGQAFLNASKFIESLTPQEVEEFAKQLVEAVSALIQLVEWFVKAIVFIVRHGETIVELTKLYIALKIAIWGTTTAAAGSVAGSAAASKGLGLLGQVAAGVGAFFAGWQLGKILKEKFLAVEIFSIRLTKVLHLTFQTFISVVMGMVRIASASFRSLAENTVNGIANMATSVANMVPGIDIKAPKVDFGSKDAWSRYDAGIKSGAKELNAISTDYDWMEDQAVAKREKKESTLEIDTLTEKAKTQIEEQRALMGEFEKLKLEAEAAIKKMNPAADKDADPKAVAKAARDYVGLMKEMASNIKKAYEGSVTEINNMVESRELSPTQGYERQIAALKKYIEEAGSILYQGLNRGGITAKAREDLQGELNQLIKYGENQDKKLRTEQYNERKSYLESIEDLEVEVGLRRMSNLDTFVREWNRKNSFLVDRAKMEGDTDTQSRLNAVATRGVYKNAMRENDSVGYNTFEASKDRVSTHGDLFKFDAGTQTKAVIGQYEELFKDLNKLLEQQTLNETEATKIHNSLMMERMMMVRQSAAEVAEAKINIGNGSWTDGFLVALEKVSDGFTNLRSQAIKSFIKIGESITDEVATNLKDAIIGAQSLGEAFRNIARSIVEQLITAIIQMGIQWAATMLMSSLMSKTIAAESTAVAAASGTAITAAMTPAAATTSLATMGANTVTASAGVLAFGGVMAAMLGALLAGAFDNGGYIPDGKLGIVGEYGPEIVQGPVAVTGRKTTEDIISSAVGNKDSRNVQVNQVEQKSEPVQQVIHQHNYTINAIDPKSFGKFLAKSDNSRAVANSLSKFSRTFGKTSNG